MFHHAQEGAVYLATDIQLLFLYVLECQICNFDCDFDGNYLGERSAFKQADDESDEICDYCG